MHSFTSSGPGECDSAVASTNNKNYDSNTNTDSRSNNNNNEAPLLLPARKAKPDAWQLAKSAGGPKWTRKYVFSMLPSRLHCCLSQHVVLDGLRHPAFMLILLRICHLSVVASQSGIGCHSIYRETSSRLRWQTSTYIQRAFLSTGAIVKLSGSDEKAWLPLEPRPCPMYNSLVCQGLYGPNRGDGAVNGQEEHIAQCC